MNPLFQIAEFVRGVRNKRRFGKLSRAPLELLRFQLQGATAECDWIARSSDEWDSALPGPIRDQNFSLQALQDAMALREMLFEILPGVSDAELRAFRESARDPRQLIIFGRVTRDSEPVLRVTSPAMRAKLYGFYFRLTDGVLGPLEIQDSSMQFMVNA